MKTDDGYFLGFPSLWNVVALYLYMLPLGPWPSPGRSWSCWPCSPSCPAVPLPVAAWPAQPAATLLGVPWMVPLVWLIWSLPPARRVRRGDLDPCNWAWISLFYPVFYLGVSWVISVSHWQRDT